MKNNCSFIVLLLIGVLCGQGFSEQPEENLMVVAQMAKNNSVESDSSVSQSDGIRSNLEFKVGYFFFNDSKMSDVYDKGGLDLQLCGSAPIWKWLQVYGSVEYLEKHGRSLHGHQKANIWEIPLSLGLQAVAKIYKKADYYFTLGPRYVFFHMHTNSHYVDKSLNENGIGGFANTGFHFFPIPHLVIDVFGEYSYCRLRFHPHKKNVQGESAQVGGFAFGGGIGYAF